MIIRVASMENGDKSARFTNQISELINSHHRIFILLGSVIIRLGGINKKSDTTINILTS